ncbi:MULTISPECIES: alpha/beta hydrolase family protein [Dyella]|uniref:S9 family peptidase n=2 Tax=Dyella TaxID=231454 RepID=A0A4R0Z1W3_9GAMM|nr:MULTISPECIES: S9 family peptidase [Dyella]TBR40156.1 S9 family peptidase [Dyella terrae]TCI12260.1 S9 family peptidase [Dyella soli]
MSYRLVRTVLSAACLLLPAVAAAGDLIPTVDFARHGEVFNPSLSPTGQYIAARVDSDQGKSHALYIYKVSDMSQPISVIRLPRYELPYGIRWVSDTRLIVEKGKQLGALDKAYSTGEILATDVDGKHQDYLYGPEAGKYGTRATTRGNDWGWGFIDGMPIRSNGHFYMRAHEWGNDSTSSLYDVNATNSVRTLVGDISVFGLDFIQNNEGKVRFSFGTNNQFKYVIYRRDGSNWTKLEEPGWLWPVAYTADGSRFYAQYSRDGGPYDLIEQDESGANRTTIAKADFGEIGDFMLTPITREPFVAYVSTGIPKPIYIKPDSAPAKLHMALSKAFPGQKVSFLNYSEDGNILLFSVFSDRNPGAFYLIDTRTNKVTKLFATRPWIDPATMAERRPVRFKASDGQELEAFLTMPKGAGETNLPMVLLPHGGPESSDDWSFDSDAQFLASRGYLVLQVNYRSSTGRGPNFSRSGDLKWGTRVQDDIIDAVKWTIEQQYADAKRICVYGWSFGGYSALMAVEREPDMFKCAASGGGVYDWAKIKKDEDRERGKGARSYNKTTLGDDIAKLTDMSPVTHVDKIKVPLLIVHGEDDQTVPFSQAKILRSALDKAGKQYEWFTKAGEGHGFYDEKNQTEFLDKLAGFIEKNIGPGARGSASQVSQN